MQEKHVVFMDQVGRHVVGVLVEATEHTITVSNPVFLNLDLNPQTGEIGARIYPVLFFELLKKELRNQNNWVFNRSQITESDVVLNDGLIAQYKQINTPPAEPSAPKVISINDIEKEDQ